MVLLNSSILKLLFSQYSSPTLGAQYDFPVFVESFVSVLSTICISRTSSYFPALTEYCPFDTAVKVTLIA